MSDVLAAPSQWARARQSGAYGLRRGAWYRVVNDSLPQVVILDVRRENVPVPRALVELSAEQPRRWSVVQWDPRQAGARRAGEQNWGLQYAVCPACSQRRSIEPPDAGQLTCPQCRGTFAVDWEHPC